jgi:hypothetical protein
MSPYLSILLPVLVAALIGIRVYDVRNKQIEANSNYNKFKDVIWPFLHSILSGSGNLNAELLQHFPNHKNAAREYVENLKGKKKIQFGKLWAAYEDEYLQVNSLGAFAPAVAIAPSHADLTKGPNAGEMEQWETDRVNKITVLLKDLLKVAKVKIWF